MQKTAEFQPFLFLGAMFSAGASPCPTKFITPSEKRPDSPPLEARGGVENRRFLTEGILHLLKNCGVEPRHYNTDARNMTHPVGADIIRPK